MKTLVTCFEFVIPTTVLLVLLAVPAADAQSVDPTHSLSASPLVRGSFGLRAEASTTDTSTLTHHSVLLQYANCAAWVVDTVFGKYLPVDSPGSANTGIARQYFWHCTSYQGWPAEIRSADFVGSPVHWVESIFRASDLSLQTQAIIHGMALLDGVESDINALRYSNCALYDNLYDILVQAMDPDASVADLSAEPDGETACASPS